MEKEKEFNLSEKRLSYNKYYTKDDCKIYLDKDIKEFIKRLKGEIRRDSVPMGVNNENVNWNATAVIINKIDELAGDKLI